MKVDYKTQFRDGRDEVYDIRPHQEPAPQQGAKESTSPKPPAAAQPAPAKNNGNPIKVLAGIDDVDPAKKTARVQDEQGTIYLLKWAKDYVDEKMGKVKRGYFREFTLEPDGDFYIIVSVRGFAKEDIPAWVGQRYKGQGGRGGYVKNDKAAMLGCLVKCAVDLKKTQLPPGQTFNLSAVLGECVRAASDNLPAACSAAGVQ